MRGNVFEGGHARPRFTDLSTACGQFGNNKRLALAIGAALLAGAFSFMPAAEAEPLAGALPVLDTKDAAVTIATSGSTMNIASAENNNLIRWVDFSVGKDATVAFGNQNYLNYVTGSARSEIYGTLTGYAGKNIYLVNPNGILIGEGASVNVGSLYLSTRTLGDTQFNNFRTNGTNPLTSGAIGGDVINMGTLNATNITVDGKNITFKNVANVKNATDTTGNTLLGGANVNLTANGGEIHIGSVDARTPTYNMSGTKYMYQLLDNTTKLSPITNLSGNYMMAENIDMSGTTFDSAPIGSFSGRFDGLNYQIKNLTINSSAQHVGLFGVNNGVIENVKLVDSNVTGTKANGTSVGGIVGENRNMVRNVSFTANGDGTAKVLATGTSTNVWVGGIVGSNKDGTVMYAYNTGTVENHGTGYTGGIVGRNYSENHNAIVQCVYNTGEVTSTNSATGGIVGNNQKKQTHHSLLRSAKHTIRGRFHYLLPADMSAVL